MLSDRIIFGIIAALIISSTITTGVCTVIFAVQFYAGNPYVLAPYVLNFIAFCFAVIAAVFLGQRWHRETLTNAANVAASTANVSVPHGSIVVGTRGEMYRVV